MEVIVCCMLAALEEEEEEDDEDAWILSGMVKLSKSTMCVGVGKVQMYSIRKNSVIDPYYLSR